MYVLRNYQKEAIKKGCDFFDSSSKKRPVIVLPTGAGKSIVIAHISKHVGNVIVLQPTAELLEQNYQKYQETIKGHPDLPNAAKYSASVGVKEKANVTFATIGSVYKKPEYFVEFPYAIVDECHNVPPKKKSMYTQFFSAINSRVLGLTATPFRNKKYIDPFSGERYTQVNLLNREVPKFFNEFLYIVQMKELVDMGYLCPINYIKMKWDGSFLRFNTTGAEYDETSVREALKQNQIIEKIPGILRQAFEKGQKSCLVFVNSVNEAKRLSEEVADSAYVHALAKKAERKKAIEDFKKGKIKVMFNVSVLNEGFDYPELDTIIIARPTASLTLYTQIIGRGMRNAPGKQKCSVVDLCGNLDRFGRLEDISLVKDENHGWILRTPNKILSGRPIKKIAGMT